jgi:hypothetical protein
MGHRIPGSILSDNLRRIGGRLARAAEIALSSTRPGNDLALQVRDRNDRIVEGGQYVHKTSGDVLGTLCLANLDRTQLFLEEFLGSRLARTPPTNSTGFAGATGVADSAGAAVPLSAAGALAAFAGFLSAAGAASVPIAALTGFSFLGADFSSAMAGNYSLALVTPTVLRGPLRVRALVLVR